MADTIAGTVTNVVDGDTFDLRVYHQDPGNSRKYNDNERIRITDIDAPELQSSQGQRSKDALERKIKGKTVVCYVQARDTFGRLVCEVRV